MMKSIGSVTCSSAFDVAQKVHTSLIMIGGAVRPEEAATVLRSHDPRRHVRPDMLLKIKPSRKVELEKEIGSILGCQFFPPGQAGSFAASSCLERRSSGVRSGWLFCDPFRNASVRS